MAQFRLKFSFLMLITLDVKRIETIKTPMIIAKTNWMVEYKFVPETIDFELLIS